MKKETLKELGLAREPCINVCEPMTEEKRRQVVQNPLWEQKIKGE